MKEEAEDEEAKEEGERCVVLHCVLAAPAALPLCCLAHPASGRWPITAQESSATSVQCVRTNRGGRRYRDVRKTRGGRRGGEADWGERDERRRRWKWEEAGGEKGGRGRRRCIRTSGSSSSLHHFLRAARGGKAFLQLHQECREKTKDYTCMLMSHSHLSTCQQQEGK